VLLFNFHCGVTVSNCHRNDHFGCRYWHAGTKSIITSIPDDFHPSEALGFMKLTARGEQLVTNAKCKPLRLTAGAVIVIAVAIQTLFIAFSWWDFDPRLSCDRLLYWGEWIECLHGTSHQYILTIEFAASSWIVGGIAMLLGLFLPRYISVLLPAGAAVASILVMIEMWDTQVTPYVPFGEPTPRDIFHFAIVAGSGAVFLVGPITGAWLFGLSARAGRLRLKESRVA